MAEMAGHFTNIKYEIIKKCFYITINIFVWLVLNTTADEEFYGCEEIDDCQTKHVLFKNLTCSQIFQST
jgi:hypothetical protein